MFNFLNSAVLVAAVAALIPLLIHLFSKRKVKIIEFSSLKHLKEMQKRQVRRIKIRQLLLLILRMLIILIAVLAFARPASRGGYIGSHAGVSSIIMLDRSASMQRQVKDGRLYDLARKSVGDILQNFGQSDELLLMSYDRQAYFPAGERFFSRDVAANLLSEANVGYDSDNFQEAYNKALGLLTGAQNLNKELYIVTDRQPSSLPERVDTAEQKISCYAVDLPLETDGNCGITGVDLGGQLIEVGSDFTVKSEIQNYDNFAKSNLLASLFIDGIRVMQTEFAIEGKGRQTVQFRGSVFSPGLHYGWIEISDDAFLADNRFYYSFRLPDQFNILIVDCDRSGELLQLALVPSEKLARYWSVKMVGPETLNSIRLNEYDAVVISGLATLGTVETSQLLRYVDDGGGLFIIVGPNIDPAYFNGHFGSALHISIVEPPPASFSGAGYYSLERFDYSHPIFKAFTAFQKDSLPAFKFYALPAIRNGAGHHNLAYFSNGAPAIVESGHGLGKIVLMTAPILPKYTDLAAHSFFVPFIIRTMVYLAGDVSEYEATNLVGQNTLRILTDRQGRYGSLQMILPDNRIYSISGTEKTARMVYDCRPIDMPGIYQLKADDRLVDIFPVNISSSESDLSAVSLDKFRVALKIDNFKTIPYGKSSAGFISEARFGRELWKIFLWAAVIVMLVEMIFSREGEAEVKEP